MRVLSDALLADLRHRLDIVDVVSEYVSLRRTGRNFVGLCPFHNERSPSFSVSPDKQLYHCFGCGAGGSVIQFIMDIEGLPFLEAVKLAASRAGLELPLTDDEQEERSSSASRRQRMKDAHELAAKWYSYILMNTTAGVQALTYLETRGISKKTLVEFQIGYAPDANQGVVHFLQRRGFESDLLVDSGLAVAFQGRAADRFRGRIIIPITDAQGAVIAFGGRALSDAVKPKYLNSPETPLFHKSRVLFNQHRARKAIREAQMTVMMEGYMDVIAAYQAGVANAVATLGTAFSGEQATTLKRYAERVVIAYDGDNAGIAAAAKAVAECDTSGLSCGVLVLPDGADPDEFIRERGAEAFVRQLGASVLTPVQFAIYDAKRTADLATVGGRQTFIREVLAVLAKSASPIEIETEIRQLSMEFQVSTESLKEELSRISKSLSSVGRRRDSTREVPTAIDKIAKGHELAGLRVLQAMLIDRRAYEYLLNHGVDELASAEQTALLAIGYAYLSSHDSVGSAEFVDSLNDENLRKLAITVFMLDDAPAPTPSILEDYLRTIHIERTMTEWRVAIEAWKQAQLRSDPEAERETKVRMESLAAKLQRLKSLPDQSHLG